MSLSSFSYTLSKTLIKFLIMDNKNNKILNKNSINDQIFINSINTHDWFWVFTDHLRISNSNFF